ncbi:hypothetical protein HRbin12_00189 [bacterium HR12]|nr:hypothetical protein HRbin12_00189 [bacterium HR12]GIV00715.1 MAG: hypothetical protein KatS3mg014_2330 [Actinomycetota bacterium]
MTDKRTLTERERDAWAEVRRLVDALPPERLEEPTVTAEGWTVKDVLWHIAHWWTDLARMLDEMREGTFVEPPDDEEATDAENARVLEESRSMSLADVEQGVDVARARMLAAWDALPEVDETAERWFLWETIEHYEEHLADLRRFAERGA